MDRGNRRRWKSQGKKAPKAARMKDDTTRSGRAAKGGPPRKGARKTVRVSEDAARSQRPAMGDSSRHEAANGAPAADDSTHFGYETVPLADKQHRVNDVFRSVARRYDLMNDLMSAGLHRVWKEALVTALRPSRTRPFRHLDVAGGTGDVAFRILDAGGPGTHVTVLDINGAMLSEARARAGARHQGRIDFVEANAEALPFEPKAFDAYTVAFGIRNVPRIDVALREAHRVLKTGGHFLCLEFSKVDVPGFDALYEAYSFNVIPTLGQVVAGDAESYRYLVESIRRFPPPVAFARMIEEAGFRRVTHRLLSGGVVAIHSGWKVV
jgi:demethylmenaquinone methyltransferase / 2-methoxy-6-polyprenyl-1,4-benzoquinol methylase